MNKNKICSNLLNQVKTLNTKNFKDVFVFSNNFNNAKLFLDTYKYHYKPYKFINCFYLPVDEEDLNILTNQNEVVFIASNSKVQALSSECDFLNLQALTEGKFFGQGQTICFIDTGIHPHFDFIFPKSKIIKFIDLVNNKDYTYDDNGHGTFVSGVACGNGVLKDCFKGVATEANIISIKALSSLGEANSNTILDAMQWVYDNYKKYNISVVCMSFGAESLEKFDPLSKGAEALWKSGITVVAAAGNSGPIDKTIKSPGSNPYIITVGGLDAKNLSVATFSSRGPTIYGHKPDLLAPAVNIISCNNKISPYTTMSGTSVATPIIAGVCAIIKSRYPSITNNEIKKFLLSHCTKITGNINQEGAGYLRF